MLICTWNRLDHLVVHSRSRIVSRSSCCCSSFTRFKRFPESSARPCSRRAHSNSGRQSADRKRRQPELRCWHDRLRPLHAGRPVHPWLRGSGSSDFVFMITLRYRSEDGSWHQAWIKRSDPTEAIAQVSVLHPCLLSFCNLSCPIGIMFWIVSRHLRANIVAPLRDLLMK